MSFLKFERMITPVFIQIMFWIGFLASILSGFAMIGFGIISDSGGFLNVLAGLAMMLIGPLIVRIYCEMLIVIFKMHGSLIDIKNSVAQESNLPSVEREEEIV